jgi:nucleoside-diphosphate-sugar epimerase
MSEHFLVTGAMGCIGAWVVRNLIREGAQVTAFELSDNPQRMKQVMTSKELAQVRFIKGDVTDSAAVVQAMAAGITHVIHLAALQVPFCKADPVLGARVNVVGTVNMFEAAKQAGIKHLVYASSIAVFGGSDEYGDDPLTDDAPLKPRTLYGVYKQANEGTARIYWQDCGISSIALRPYTVYGVGRDQGLTSAPTKAMFAAAQGQGYHIPFGGQSVYQYVDDTARLFIRAARAKVQGAEVFNLRGSTVHMSDIIAGIEAIVPQVAGKITFDDVPLPFPSDTDDARIAALLGDLRYTSLEDGIRESITMFQALLADGRMMPSV